MVTDSEEGVRLGADTVSIGVTIGGDYQADQMRNLGRFTKEAEQYCMLVVAHIYPWGGQIESDKKCLLAEYRLCCVRRG